MTVSKRTTETALALNAWWRTQRRWKTKAAAAHALGIPASTFKDYFYGALPSEQNRMKLQEATGIEISRDPLTSPRSASTSPAVDEADAKLSEVSQTLRLLSDQFASLHEFFEQLKAGDRPGRVVPFPKGASAHRRADETSRVMYELIAALDSFRSSAADREVLRDRLHGPDVGYLVSLATALLDEARFESWSAVSSYRPLGARR